MRSLQQNSNQWQVKVEVMRARLHEDDLLITYLEMVEATEIPSPYRIHQLAEFLEDLIRRDVTLGQPIRAARVVSKRDRLPADGFFDCLSDAGVAPEEGESRADFHQRLLGQKS